MFAVPSAFETWRRKFSPFVVPSSAKLERSFQVRVSPFQVLCLITALGTVIKKSKTKHSMRLARFDWSFLRASHALIWAFYALYTELIRGYARFGTVLSARCAFIRVYLRAACASV